MNKFLITGMFRSGSTLLSRLLDNKKEIYCNSDVFFFYLKLLRFEVLKKEFPDQNFDSPMDDYFSNLKDKKKFKILSNSELPKEFSKKYLYLANKFTFKRAELYDQQLGNYLKKNKIKNIESLFQKMENFTKKYKKKKIFGFKANWCEELSYILLENFPKLKVIFIIRDPRAIISSKLSKKLTYPIVPMIYYWRKSSEIIIDLLNNKQFKKKIYIIKYENLIHNPSYELKKIYKFLNISDNRFNLNVIKDGNRKNWQQNTSYSYKKKNNFFNKNGIEAWKKNLNINQQFIIENMCYREMKFFGYRPKKDKKFLTKFKPIKNLNVRTYDPKFIQNLNYKNFTFNKRVFEKERNRGLLLKKNINELNVREIKKYFLTKETFDVIKKINF